MHTEPTVPNRPALGILRDSIADLPAFQNALALLLDMEAAHAQLDATQVPADCYEASDEATSHAWRAVCAIADAYAAYSAAAALVAPKPPDAAAFVRRMKRYLKGNEPTS